jgi:hypothetical protein
MFLVNLERQGHDHLHAYTCSNCKKTAQFVPLSVLPTRIDKSLETFAADYGEQEDAIDRKALGEDPTAE